MMLRSSEGSRAERFDARFPMLARLRPHAPRALEEMDGVLALTERFRREHVEPHALAIESCAADDPAHVPEELLRAACQAGYFGMMIPRMFGGRGLPFGAVTIALEEISAGCVGIANVIGVHGLALCTVAATGDVAALGRLARLLAKSEHTGKPKLLSTAITEPSAGTDVEDVELLRKARLVCEAKPVRGGYLLSGRKVFISNGSLAAAHVVIAPTDRKRPVETTFAFIVEEGTPGLSIGRVERKMGQKACPAAELVFEDCFVPEANRISSEPLPGRRIDLVLGATRGAVGAFAAGVARGAYERALTYARAHRHDGRWLLDQQWAQMLLAEMLRNVMIARALYVNAMLENELFGLTRLMAGPTQVLERTLPQAILDSAPIQLAVASTSVTKQMQRGIAELPTWMVDVASAHGAAAKVTTTDLGMANCHLALDLMGADGLRRDRGMEKLYRDAKLLQIYEGTNQLNRLELFKKGVYPSETVRKNGGAS